MHEVGYASLALEPYGLCYCFVPFTTPDESPGSKSTDLSGESEIRFRRGYSLAARIEHAPIAGS